MGVCKYCGKKIKAKDAYVVETIPLRSKSFKAVKIYYCNEDEYKKQFNKEINVDAIYKILGYLIGDNPSYNLIKRELTDLIKLDDGKKIYDYLTEQKNSLDELLQSKEFTSQYNKTKYLISIIKNEVINYESTEKQSVDIKLTSVITDMDVLNINKFKDKKKRRSLADIEERL